MGKDLTHVSLFTGSGIPCLAAASVGIRTVAMCENDPACCYALRKLWPDAMLFDDVKTADWSKVPQPVFILDAGVPCQPVSTAGKQKGDKDDRWLWPETIRAVRELRPAWLLFENPRAIVLHGLDRIVDELEREGYEFLPKGRNGRYAPLCIGADDIGAPHRRKRVWIVAHDSSERCGTRWRNTTGKRSGGGKPDQPCREMADPIGNLCGRGGDESERGPEGGTAAGRAGSPMEHATRSRQPGNHDQRIGDGEPSGAGRAEPVAAGGRADGESAQLGHPYSPRLAGRQGEPGDDGTEREAAERAGGWTSEPGRCRWPARPGEPQHEWEASRLVEFGVGSPANELARRIHARLDGTGNGIPPHKAASAANKSLLRMIGNAWVYELAVLMFRTIAELERFPLFEQAVMESQ